MTYVKNSKNKLNAPLQLYSRKACLLIVVIIVCLSTFSAGTIADETIVTVAGNGTGDYSGDGGPAVNAHLYDPSEVALDEFGNLYIADSDNNRVRMVDTEGIITTVAGSGILGYSGDGDYAVNAQLARPSGVAVDESGNLHIADSGNNCIRKVDTEGIITTVAGLGGNTWGYSGDGGPAVNAQLAWPSSIAFDKSGNFYIADSGNHCIRKVYTKDHITKITGLGNKRIRTVYKSGNIITVAGNGAWGYSGEGGPAVKAQLFWPSGVTFDGLGNLYIADYGNNCIRKVDTKGHISTIAGLGGDETWGYSGDGGVAVKAQLAFPSGLTVDELGNLYIADLGNNCVRKVDAEGIITTIAGNDNMLVNSQLNWPSGVTVDGSGDLYIADSSNNRILKTEDQIVSSIVDDAEQKQVVLLTKMEDQ